MFLDSLGARECTIAVLHFSENKAAIGPDLSNMAA